jgi:hypothetical protein
MSTFHVHTPNVGVLIHGCHLQAEGWENIMFGEDGRMGRVPAGLIEAVNRNAKSVFWGTGASQSKNGIISSPTHIARCMQEACKIQGESKDRSIRVYAKASETCYANTTPSDVVIVEPPHRGDMPKVPFHQTTRKIFAFLQYPDLAFKYNKDWNTLTNEYKNRLVERISKAA